MMRESGTLVDWKDEKGFGFIQPDVGGRQLFVHVKSIGNMPRRPQVGDRIEYERGAGKDGRPRAEAAQLLIVPPINPVPYLLAVFCVAVSVLAMKRTGFPFPLVYVLMSGITYALYDYDKKQAQIGAYRVPENTLHLAEFLGGWCGGYLAQQRFRHKTIKGSYQTAFWMIIVVHLVGWGYYLWTALQPVKH